MYLYHFLQELFEKLFSPYGSGGDRSFIYLKTFHRARVTFNNEENAKEAKKDLQGQLFLGYELGVFLVQVINQIIMILLNLLNYDIFLAWTKLFHLPLNCDLLNLHWITTKIGIQIIE